MRKEKSGMFRLPKQVRKALAATLSLSMIFGTTVFTSYAEDSKTIFMGDVNQSGDVTLDDVTLALKGALTIEKLADDQKALADMNYDKDVNLDDVTEILKVALTINDPYTPTPAPSEDPVTPDPGPTDTPTPDPGPTDTPTPDPGPTDTPDPGPTDTPDPGPVTETPVTEVPKVTVGTYDFETKTGVIAMNDDSNGSVLTTTTETSPGSVLLLGKPNEEADAIMGVQMTNPFAGKTEFSQSILGAFAKTGITLNAHTYLHKGDDADSKDDDYRRVLDASTREKAISKYDSAVASYERNLLRDYVSDQALDTKYIAEHPEDTANATLAAVRDNTRKGNLTGAAFGLPDSKVYLKDYTQDDLFNSYSTGGYDPAKDELDNYAFPYPSWTNGLTVSVWVKIDATLDSSKTGTPIYSFSDGIGALTIRTDGRVQFTEGITSDETKRNSFVFSYDKSVMNNAGQWVYVTTVIRNDGIVVYYNGVKAEGKPESGYQNYKKNQKTFNYGFGYDDGRSVAEMTAGLADEGRYSDLLKNFKPTETDYSDISRYYVDERQVALVDFVISPYTELYLGGDDGSVIWGLSGYSAANEGMMLDDMSFAGYPMDATDAAVAYDNATMHHNADFDAVKSTDFAEEDIIPLTAEEVENLQKTAGYKSENGVLTMTEDIADATLGIQLVNPFSTMFSELHEEVGDALARTGIVLNANIRKYNAGTPDDISDDYYRVTDRSTKLGVFNDKYVGMFGDAAKNCYALAYYLDNTDTGQAALAGYMTKYHPDLSGDALVEAKTSLIALFAAGAKGAARNNYEATAEAMGIAQKDYFTDDFIENGSYEMGKDYGCTNPTNDALDVYQFPYPTWEKGVTMSFYAKVDGVDITRAAVVLADNAGNAMKDTDGKVIELTVSGDGLAYNASDEAVTTTTSAVVDDRVSPMSNLVPLKENATIFTFENSDNVNVNLGAMTFKADGTFLYCGNRSGDRNAKRNAYGYKFANGAPADNFDQWVYVTIIIQNDGVRVLYDGVEAAGKHTSGQYVSGKNGSAYFNYGFGVATNSTPESRTAALANENKYQDILKNFTGLATDFSDFHNYSVDETRIPMLDFLADTETQLYIGGGDEKSLVVYPANNNAAGNYAGYTFEGSTSGASSTADASTAEANIGMQLSDMSFHAQVLPDRIIARDYNILAK